jgi:hypothetical protein
MPTLHHLILGPLLLQSQSCTKEEAEEAEEEAEEEKEDKGSSQENLPIF